MIATLRNVSSPALIIVLGACASNPGAQPQDMSKAQHEQLASQHDKAADTHAAAYDQNATKEVDNRAYDGSVLFTAKVNPTAEHKADAERHRKLAAEHRAASQALAGAENASCSGVAGADRDTSPFEQRADIVSVAPYERKTGTYAAVPMGVHGAVVKFRPVQGLTAEYLQRVVNCHLARNATFGFSMPEMSFCPLNVKGARAKVASVGDGFTVTIESDDLEAAKEILRRAQALK